MTVRTNRSSGSRSSAATAGRASDRTQAIPAPRPSSEAAMSIRSAARTNARVTFHPIVLGGLFNGNFCSECAADTDCPEGQLCAPQVEFMDLMNIVLI